MPVEQYADDDSATPYSSASNMAIQPDYPPRPPPRDARWVMGALAAQDQYQPVRDPWSIGTGLPDVGSPLISPGPQVSAGVPAVNRAADVASRVPGHMMGGLLSMPQQLLENSQEALNTGTYDPRGPVNAALMTMGAGGIVGVPVKGAETLLGAGAVRTKPTVMPQVAERYPETTPPVLAIDPVKNKEFLQKANSPEAEAVSKARVAAQRDINQGNYTPYFDPAKRFDVDPANYPPIESTLTQLAKRPGPANAAAYAAAAGPEAAARLDAAYARGMQQSAGAGDWYHMGQLENEFIKEYGPTEGPKQFKAKFADAMAATTGGADPTSNLMMAHYGNYLQAKGLPLPAKSYDYPFPVGGRFAGSNMEQYRKMLMEGAGVTAANPKRYNFAGNFTGNRLGSTIDEQMMGLIEPGGSANPPGGAYGQYEAPVAARAAAAGVDPRYFQEVAWAGAKDAKTKGGYTAQPMIGVVNEAIERTHRITGMPKAEIVRRGLVRSEIPLYGAAGATTMGALAASDQYQDNGR
jgi:hypothetical protein